MEEQSVPVATPSNISPTLSPITEPVSGKFGIKTAVIMVALVGLVSTGGAVYYLTQAKSPRKTQPPAVVQLPSPTPPVLFLTLQSPQEETPIVDGELLVRGKTLPATTVAIATGTDDTIVESDASGEFADTIILNGSEDTLTVTAFSDTGEDQTISQPIIQQ